MAHFKKQKMCIEVWFNVKEMAAEIFKEAIGGDALNQSKVYVVV